MFTSKDLSIIQNPYFTVFSIQKNSCEIQSKNTMHMWQIKKSLDGFYLLQHKHEKSNPYHIHAAYISVQDCLLDIADHDEFQMNGRKHKKRNSLKHTFFEYIIKTYSNSNEGTPEEPVF